MSTVNFSIIGACFTRIASKIDSGALIQDALRDVAYDLEVIQSEDWGKSVPSTLPASEDRFAALDDNRKSNAELAGRAEVPDAERRRCRSG